MEALLFRLSSNDVIKFEPLELTYANDTFANELETQKEAVSNEKRGAR